MAKTKKVDWALSPAPESKDHGHIDQVLVWVSGSLLVLMVLLGLIDVLDFARDPSQHAIGQGSNVGAEGWELGYLSNATALVIVAVSVLGLLLFCTRDPQKRWTAPVLRIVSATIIGVVAFGYILWTVSGYDH